MKDFLYYTLTILVISLIIMQPSILKEFSSTPLGKILFLIAIVTFVESFKVLSFFILILYICLNSSHYESFVEGMSNENNFRKENCENNKLKENTDVSKLKYKNKKCNPCDRNCKFTITSSNEQLTQKDSVTPINSKDAFVIKEALRATDHVEPFSNILENMTVLDQH